jgi:hypothetical protein
MLQNCTRTLDGTLRKKFQQWYSGALLHRSPALESGQERKRLG